MTDLTLTWKRHSPVYTITANSPRAAEWLYAECDYEDYQEQSEGLLVEPRFAFDILEAAVDEGMTVNEGASQ